MGHMHTGQPGSGHTHSGSSAATHAQRSFDQVKSILGKLDRNIDAARSRRLHDHTPGNLAPAPLRNGQPASAGANAPALNNAASESAVPSGLNAIIGAPKNQNTMIGTGSANSNVPASPKPAQAAGGMDTPTNTNLPRSPFGRATPMRIPRPNSGPMTGT